MWVKGNCLTLSPHRATGIDWCDVGEALIVLAGWRNSLWDEADRWELHIEKTEQVVAMSSWKRPGWLTVAVAALVSAVLAGGGVAVASHDDPDTLHACVRDRGGFMRLVEEPADCRRRETSVSWGVAGPTGPQGELGPAGPQGEPGPAGVATIAVRTATFVVDGTTYPDFNATAQCLPEEIVTGGGLSTDTPAVGDAGIRHIIASNPVFDGTAWGWYGEIAASQLGGPPGDTWTVHAVCAAG